MTKITNQGFAKPTAKTLDLTLLSEGDVANATLTSFRYMKGWCFGSLLTTTEHSLDAILGSKAECPIKDMLELKGINVSVRFGGIRTVDDKTYGKFSIAF